MTQLKPQLACDWEEGKMKLPAIIMPKIDGVRGCHLTGGITGRSLKPFKNNFVAECYSHDIFTGVDGELALGDWCAPNLCSVTTGFVNRKSPKPGKPTKSPEFFWWGFDYLHPSVSHLPYIERLRALEELHSQLTDCMQVGTLFLVPWRLCQTEEEVLAAEQEFLDMGFEGLIGRDPQGMHKSGRATVKGSSYWRIKRFIDFEGEIVNLIEAMENTNEAKTNELGQTERSTHQENMVPKGMVGMIQMRALADVVYNGEVMIKKDQIVDVGPGNMKHDQRVKAWQDFLAQADDSLKGKIGKAKFFPKGQKDKPRFPTFISIRAEEDMSE